MTRAVLIAAAPKGDVKPNAATREIIKPTVTGNPTVPSLIAKKTADTVTPTPKEIRSRPKEPPWPIAVITASIAKSQFGFTTNVARLPQTEEKSERDLATITPPRMKMLWKNAAKAARKTAKLKFHTARSNSALSDPPRFLLPDISVSTYSRSQATADSRTIQIDGFWS